VKSRIKNLILQRKKLRERFTKDILSIETKDISSNSKDETFLNRALNIIEENISETGFGVSELTSKMGMSRSNLHMKIKSLTNQSTSEFISAIRLKKAVQMIESTDKTITEVCYEVGFSDYAYFNRRFKKLFGKSPVKYFGQN
jgi:AraC-like DNA-binding protein